VNLADTSPKAPLSPRQLVLAEVPGALSLWQEAGGDAALGPAAALDLLATWAGLRRLAGDPLAGSGCQELDRAVRRDTVALAAQLTRLPFPGDWQERLGHLARTPALDAETTEAQADEAFSLFNRLDRLQLALAACEVLLPAADRAVLDRLRTATAEAEGSLCDEIDVFALLADEAAALLADYRDDLDDPDPLWLSLLKHRRVVEARDRLHSLPSVEQMLTPPLVRPTVCLSPPTPSNAGAALEYQVAASGSAVAGDRDRILERWADERPEDDRSADFRRAWDHFLAALFIGNGDNAERWWNEFVRLTQGVRLEPTWAARKERARQVRQEYDWRNRHRDEKAFELEPQPNRPLHREDFERRLHRWG
jgi:hypothetical protein